MFKAATRSQSKIKLACVGPSGSGKTKSSLMIAQGLAKGKKGYKIAVGDSENGSASLYAKEFKFDTVTIAPPYSTDKYMAVIDEAVKLGYGCLILDSITHAWTGSGGILDQKNMVDEKGGNSYTNWNKFTPKQQAFMEKILQSNIDIIVTMRSKQDYVLEKDEKGRNIPKKVGMAPQQREGTEYEFTTFFDINMEHVATVSKDRTELFDGKAFKITKKTGELIREWLDGADVKAEVSILKDLPPPPEDTPESLFEECEKLCAKVDSEETKAVVYKAMVDADLNKDELTTILERLREITGG